MQQQGGGQTAQLAGSKTARHEPAAGAADEAPKSLNRRGKKKQKVKLQSTSVHFFGRSGLCACMRCSMVTSLLLVPFSSAQRQQSLTCLLLIVTQCHLWKSLPTAVEFVFFPAGGVCFLSSTVSI